MALADDIVNDVTAIFHQSFDVSDGLSIPSLADIPFDNQGKKIRLVSLFVDIRKSTTLVEAMGLEAAGRMYKAYFRGITKIVNDRGGSILSFNGDGIVAGFVGTTASNAAVLSALNINWFNHEVLKPRVHAALDAANADQSLVFDYGIGIDVGDVLIVKGGMRGEENSDLVWAGNPVNYSVKVGSQASHPYCLYVSDEVFQDVHFSLKGTDTELFIWDAWKWTDKNRTLWRTSWYFGPGYVTTVPPKPIRLPPPSQSERDSSQSLLDALTRNYGKSPISPASVEAILGIKPKGQPTMHDMLTDLFRKKYE